MSLIYDVNSFNKTVGSIQIIPSVRDNSTRRVHSDRVVALYSVRWEVGVLFRKLKSLYGLDEIDTSDPVTVELLAITAPLMVDRGLLRILQEMHSDTTFPQEPLGGDLPVARSVTSHGDSAVTRPSPAGSRGTTVLKHSPAREIISHIDRTGERSPQNRGTVSTEHDWCEGTIQEVPSLRWGRVL
jgi:hypothetical protein